MSAPQFTSGPWQWVGDDEIEQLEHPFTSVAEVVRDRRQNRDDEVNANARLIAAAPELYEMTEWLERVLIYEVAKAEKGDREDDEGIRLLKLNLGLVRSALAKARGEQ